MDKSSSLEKTCCCCGGTAIGKQWWNRDDGYGMCTNCIAFVRKRGMSEEEIRDLYGVEGVHWGVVDTKEVSDERSHH